MVSASGNAHDFGKHSALSVLAKAVLARDQKLPATTLVAVSRRGGGARR